MTGNSAHADSGLCDDNNENVSLGPLKDDGAPYCAVGYV